MKEYTITLDGHVYDHLLAAYDMYRAEQILLDCLDRRDNPPVKILIDKITECYRSELCEFLCHIGEEEMLS